MDTTDKESTTPAVPAVDALTRYEPSREGVMDVIADDEIGLNPDTEYVKLADVRALLATPKGAEPAHQAEVAAVGLAFPERDQSKPAEQQGIFRKFEVNRVDGSDQPGGKHHGCRYFVLDLDHDKHAPVAMRAYAADCAATHPKLAVDIEAEFAAAAPEKVAAPEGYRLVKIEPDDAMQLAGAQAVRIDTTPLNKMFTANRVFKDMCEASVPPVPAPAERGDRVDEITMLKREIHNLKRQIEDYCQPVPAAKPSTSVPRAGNNTIKVIQALIEVAGRAYDAMDNSEERGPIGQSETVVPHADCEALSAALDVLDTLPDDKPGYVLSGPARAVWALRELFAPAPAEQPIHAGSASEAVRAAAKKYGHGDLGAHCVAEIIGAVLSGAPQAERAAVLGAKAYWMVESSSGPIWWDGRFLSRGVDPRHFTADPNLAVRFPTREDAERIANQSSGLVATEHVWLAAPVAQEGEQMGSAQAAPQSWNTKLFNFIDSVVEVAFEGGDLDGGTIQEWAETAGLLEARTMVAPCSEGQNCRCADGNDFPLTCYQKTYRRAAADAQAAPATRPSHETIVREGDAMSRADFIERIVLSVAEIPDRDSPEDQPEMMLVTGSELSNIVKSALADADEIGGLAGSVGAPAKVRDAAPEEDGVFLIAAERRRQVEKEGWCAEHDDEHEDASLAMAAALYASPEPLYTVQKAPNSIAWTDPWPWHDQAQGALGGWHKVPAWDKRKTHPRIRQLVIAGALIAAELDRLNRAALRTTSTTEDDSQKGGA